MAFSTDDHRGFPDDYGTYPPPPPYPPWHPQPPPPSHGPPPGYPPSVPARENTALHQLRSAYRLLRRGMAAALLAYYSAFLVMAAYLPDVMGAKVAGNLNLGVCLGLSLVPITLAAILVYEFLARSTVDPVAHRVRIVEAEAREKARAQQRWSR
ncbi:hypothetical protein GCM10012287_31290 [Streptomyces daqingensis]|uniref:DUF485 domain-containing protein n=1 Tax=Streptomyces daqingensis TaxID=1472640 RepID=A0ABQ2MFT0_9ACTN|nr:DUF485 domain-containing protein [Streptomyces daqingensis]GGO50770.1 hypothetical protein GCM10012287_31290 [Streptomyces daqingensis]